MIEARDFGVLRVSGSPTWHPILRVEPLPQPQAHRGLRRETNGDVKIFSSLHVSGERLRLLTGVAAILRFPCPELDEDDEDD